MVLVYYSFVRFLKGACIVIVIVFVCICMYMNDEHKDQFIFGAIWGVTLMISIEFGLGTFLDDHPI